MTFTSGETAIAGLGITPMTRQFTKNTTGLAVDAISEALNDAGLQKSDLDGLLICAGINPADSIDLQLQRALGLRDLRLAAQMLAFGSTAVQMVQYASLAIAAGMADVVACVFADAPLQSGTSAGAAYSFIPSARPSGVFGIGATYGAFGANSAYAMAARRHMALYGTTHDHLGAIAVSNRQWAAMNPIAMQRSPLTIDDYHSSRWIVEPFHLLDCTLVSNGAVAVIVTSAERAAELRQPPVHVLGMGQGHPGNPHRAGFENEVNTGAVIARDTVFGMSGLSAKDIDVCELYDCYTYTTLVTLEDYGFCAKGEGGPFVADGRLAPGGELPTNTGGGMLSGYYMWGMTPLSEGIIQARGQGGDRQAPRHDAVLVTAQGGLLDYHAALVLSPHRSNN